MKNVKSQESRVEGEKLKVKNEPPRNIVITVKKGGYFFLFSNAFSPLFSQSMNLSTSSS